MSVLVEHMPVVLVALRQLVVTFALIPNRVSRNLLARALDPVTGRRNEIMRKLFAKLVCNNGIRNTLN